MDVRKWPILAQIIIALGCLGGIRGIIWGLSNRSILDAILGLAGLVIFWCVYKFKAWALIGVTVILSLNIIFTILSIFNGFSPIVGIIVIVLNGFIIYYFNSQVIKKLFNS